MKVILFAIFAGAIYILTMANKELITMADASATEVVENTIKVEKAKQDLQKLESERKHILEVTAWYDTTVQKMDAAKEKVAGVFKK